jgi:hypothetical protein
MTLRSQFVNGGGGKPIRTLTFLSGSGTFTPLAANSWVRARLQAGGGAGGSAGFGSVGGPFDGGNGGGAGEYLEFTMRVAGSVSYAVGLGGVGVPAGAVSPAPTAGGNTTFAGLVAVGGRSTKATGELGTSGTCAPTGLGGSPAAIPGGSGGRRSDISASKLASPGHLPGSIADSQDGLGGNAAGSTNSGIHQGGSGGGCSMFGVGGNGGSGGTGTLTTATNGSGFGSGGGGQGAATAQANLTKTGDGAPGFLIIEEFGPQS